MFNHDCEAFVLRLPTFVCVYITLGSCVQLRAQRLPSYERTGIAPDICAARCGAPCGDTKELTLYTLNIPHVALSDQYIKLVTSHTNGKFCSVICLFALLGSG